MLPGFYDIFMNESMDFQSILHLTGNMQDYLVHEGKRGYYRTTQITSVNSN